MLKKIREFEKASSGLEPSSGERGEMLGQAASYAELFLTELSDRKTYVADEGRNRQLIQPFSETPEKFSNLLEIVKDAVDYEGLNAASGGQMGYIPGGGLFPSALGDFLADVGNRYSGVSYASPGAARMEQQMVRWMTEIVGYPSTSGGDLTSGGSIANLTAIVTAREIMEVRARDVENSCVYLTDDTHHCVDKSLRAAGLGECRRRVVPMDKNFRMDSGVLHQMIEADQADGLRPWIIIASAGTTDTGAVDPLDEIADVADRHAVWLHVDAAFAGTALLLDEYRWMIDGIEEVDSFVFNPHKWMFANFDCSAYFVKDKEALLRTFSILPEYLKTKEGDRVNNYRDWGIALGRRFRALKLWFVIRSFGVKGIQEKIREHIRWANNLKKKIEDSEMFELMAPVPFATVCFRYKPADIKNPDKLNAMNEELLEKLNSSGRIYLTHTKLKNNYTIRIVIGQTYQEEYHIINGWELINKTAEDILKKNYKT